MTHGPAPCADCGTLRTPVWWHTEGPPWVDDSATEPTYRLVVFHGFDDTGRALWVDGP